MSGSHSSLCDSSALCGPCGRPLLAAAPKISIKILAVCDSPTVLTGFARVARNILGRWRFYEEGEPVDCWAINFDGWGYDQVGYRLFPGGKHDWNSPGKLNQLLKLIAGGQYTHLWMLMDPDALSVHGFPQKLRQVPLGAKLTVRPLRVKTPASAYSNRSLERASSENAW